MVQNTVIHIGEDQDPKASKSWTEPEQTPETLTLGDNTQERRVDPALFSVNIQLMMNEQISS